MQFPISKRHDGTVPRVDSRSAKNLHCLHPARTGSPPRRRSRWASGPDFRSRRREEVPLECRETCGHVRRCQTQVAPALNLLPALLRVGDQAEVTFGRDAIQLARQLNVDLLDVIATLQERAGVVNCSELIKGTGGISTAQGPRNSQVL